MDAVRALTEEVEVGHIYTGTVRRIVEFGCFVEILPGKEGLVRTSQLADYQVMRPEDVVSIGDEITVMVIEVDGQGRVNLSRRAALSGEMPTQAEIEQDRGGRGGNRNGGGNNRNGGSYGNNPNRDRDNGPSRSYNDRGGYGMGGNRDRGNGGYNDRDNNRGGNGGGYNNDRGFGQRRPMGPNRSGNTGNGPRRDSGFGGPRIATLHHNLQRSR
jgi:polyribonucleotide nucleotidyltransferase